MAPSPAPEPEPERPPLPPALAEELAQALADLLVAAVQAESGPAAPAKDDNTAFPPSPTGT